MNKNYAIFKWVQMFGSNFSYVPANLVGVDVCVLAFLCSVEWNLFRVSVLLVGGSSTVEFQEGRPTKHHEHIVYSLPY